MRRYRNEYARASGSRSANHRVRHRYSAPILNERIPPEADFFEHLGEVTQSLFEHYRIDRNGETAKDELLLALAFDHVPGLKPSHQPHAAVDHLPPRWRQLEAHLMKAPLLSNRRPLSRAIRTVAEWGAKQFQEEAPPAGPDCKLSQGDVGAAAKPKSRGREIQLSDHELFNKNVKFWADVMLRYMPDGKDRVAKFHSEQLRRDVESSAPRRRKKKVRRYRGGLLLPHSN